MNYFLTKSSGTIGVVHRVHMAGSWVHDIGIHSRSFNPRSSVPTKGYLGDLISGVEIEMDNPQRSGQ
jgi:hypothetical protein